MSVLRISLFGHFEIINSNAPSSMKVTRTGQALLAYLLLQRHRSHPRELLASLFWGDRGQEQARSCLNTTLWRLRRAMEPEGIERGTYLLTTSTGEVGFNCASEHWLDIAVFEAQVGQVEAKPIQAMDTTDVQSLERALALYTGELLEGFYDDWALRERERLRRLYLNSLAHLMHYYKHHRAFEESLVCGQQILDQDPLREEIHREMMRLYLENGQRALAVQQYELCREALAVELGIPPMEETQLLYSQIVAVTNPGQVQSIPVGESIGSQRALQHLRMTLQGFDKAREQLQQAIKLVERIIEH